MCLAFLVLQLFAEYRRAAVFLGSADIHFVLYRISVNREVTLIIIIQTVDFVVSRVEQEAVFSTRQLPSQGILGERLAFLG